MTHRAPRILFAGGGTGGHVYPAIAIADAVREIEPDPLGLFLAVGFTSMLVLYAFIHAGVACGLFPVTGLPLPFVSYGGTSMLATGIMVGILLNISRQIETA